MNNVAEIRLDDIIVNEDFNCRSKILPSQIMDLADNIKQMGLIQPLVLRKVGDKLYLVAGFRRYNALRRNKAEVANCVIHENLSELDAAAINLVENIERTDLTPLEEAKAIQKLVDQNYAVDKIAEKLNKSITWVNVRLYILRLPEHIQREVAAGFINLKQVRELIDLPEVLQVRYVKNLKEKQEHVRNSKLENLIKSKTVRKNISRTTKGKVRTRKDIANVREYIYDMFGSCLEVALLSWAEGNITFEDVEKEVKQQAEIFGINYKSYEDNSEQGYV